MLKKIAGILGKQRDSDVEKLEYIEYAQEFEQVLSTLESHVHESDDSQEIIMHAMKTACEFYGGDWVGFLEIDLELGLWTPTIWYNSNSVDRTINLIPEFESAEFLHRWLIAMQNNKPIIISDIEQLKITDYEEYVLYSRMFCTSLLAVPVKPRPTGYLVIRNPKRYVNRSSMLQMLAFVILASLNEENLMKGLNLRISPENIEHDTDVIINLLGNLEIYTTNGVLREADLKSPLICKLLAYMLINKKAVIQPRHLIEALWPEGAIEADMSKNLRAVIFRLRQAFNLISNHQLIDSVTTGYCFNRKLHIMTDLQQFDKLWDAAQNEVSIIRKVEVLKEIMQIYKGHILDAAYDDHWLMLTSNHYQLRYIGVTNELLRILAEQKDYHNLHKYATQSLAVENGNPKAYYWLIYAMVHMGVTEIAKSEIAMARKCLTEEEFKELEESIREIKVAGQAAPFHNVKLS